MLAGLGLEGLKLGKPSSIEGLQGDIERPPPHSPHLAHWTHVVKCFETTHVFLCFLISSMYMRGRNSVFGSKWHQGPTLVFMSPQRHTWQTEKEGNIHLSRTCCQDPLLPKVPVPDAHITLPANPKWSVKLILFRITADAEVPSPWKRVSFQGDLWETQLLCCPQELNFKAGKSSRSEWEGRGVTRQAGTWDPWLQSLHLDTSLLQQENTKKLHGTKNNHVPAQLGQILDPKYHKETNKPTVTFEEPGAKTGVRSKAGSYTRPWHTTPSKGWAKQPSHLNA